MPISPDRSPEHARSLIRESVFLEIFWLRWNPSVSIYCFLDTFSQARLCLSSTVTYCDWRVLGSAQTAVAHGLPSSFDSEVPDPPVAVSGVVIQDE